MFTIAALAELDRYGTLKDYPVVPDPVPLGSYSTNDVVFLLKDISPYIEEQGNEEREQAIQNGTHYSEMLPIEYKPTPAYIDLFHVSLKENGHRIALASAIVAQTIIQQLGNKIVLVSLARAGTPIGILIKRYLKLFCGLDVPHYSISIIRDKGIDLNALAYILHQHPGHKIQFIDGWTGKGAITTELYRSVQAFERRFDMAPTTINRSLAVLADPGHCANIFGTRDDFLIPSACLNSTVSGLMSRTFYREDLIQGLDFHGAKYYRELSSDDVSNYFIDTICSYFDEAHKKTRFVSPNDPDHGVDQFPACLGRKEARKIQVMFGISNINHVKPGVGETTRVLLRRVPWKVLVKNINNPHLKHILLLAKDREVPVEVYTEMSYACCGLIKTMEQES